MPKSRVDLRDNARLERAIMHVAFGRVRRKIARLRTAPQLKSTGYYENSAMAVGGLTRVIREDWCG